MGLVILPCTLRKLSCDRRHIVLISTGYQATPPARYIFSKPQYITCASRPTPTPKTSRTRTSARLCQAQGAVWEQDDWDRQDPEPSAKERLLADPADLSAEVYVGLFTFWYEITTRMNSLASGCSRWPPGSWPSSAGGGPSGGKAPGCCYCPFSI